MKRTYGKRVFFGVYVTAALSIVLLTSIIYLWMWEQTARNVEKARLDTLQNINAVFSSTIDGYARSASEIYMDKNAIVLLSKALTGQSGWVDAAVRYSKRANSIISNDPAVGLVALYDKTSYILMSQRESVSDSSRAQLHKDIIAGSDSISLCKAKNMVYGHPMPMLCVITGQRDFTTGLWIEGVVIAVDAHALSRKLFGGTEGGYYILDGGGNVLLSSDPLAISETLNWAGDPGVPSIADGEGRYRVVGALSESGDPEAFVSLLIILTAAGLFILLLSMVLSIVISKRLARPVDELVHDIAYIVPDNGPAKTDDMAFARAALRKTVGMIGQLRTVDLKHRRVECLMGVGAEPDREMFAGAWSLAVYQLSPPRDLPSEYAITTTGGLRPEYTDIAVVAETVSGMLEGAGDRAEYVLYPLHDNKLVLAVPDNDGLAARLFEDLRYSLDGLLDSEVAMSFSAAREDGGEGPLSVRLNETMNRLRARALRGPGAVITRTSELSMKRGELPKALADRVLYAVKENDVMLLEAAAKEMLAALKDANYNSALAGLADLCVEAYRTTREALQNSGADFPTVYASLAEQDSEAGLLFVLVEQLKKVMEHIHSAQSVTGSDIADRALAFVEAHYSEPELSLQLVAAEIGISASHFSRIFRERTGTTFPAYINSLRLKRAGELLKTSELSVTEIMRSVGFCSSSYFTASFRKYYGFTPTKARAYNRIAPENTTDEKTR